MQHSNKITVRSVADALEAFAPLALQESYDNAGLQVGDPGMVVSGVMLCLDVTEDVIEEALAMGCNMVVSHHPLIFRGLKSLTGANEVERAVILALRCKIAIYSAHTNLDSTPGGVSHEMGHMLGVRNAMPLEVSRTDPEAGLGIVGEIKPTPKLEFLRKVKEVFGVKALRFSAQSAALVVKRVAVCGGSGASLLGKAIEAGADVMITGDVKYHDYTSYSQRILIADIGHFEGELCAEKILWRIIRENFPSLTVCVPAREENPVATMI